MMSIVGIKSLAIPREQQAAHCLPVLFECSRSSGCDADSVQEQEGLRAALVSKFKCSEAEAKNLMDSVQSGN